MKRGIPVIPILLEGTRIPKPDQLPDDLKELALRNGLDVRHASFPQDMERLIHALNGAQSPKGFTSSTPSLAGRDTRSRTARVWTFLGDDKNRKVLGWIGGGIAAVVGALWAAFVYFTPPSKPPPPPASVEAKPGGIAIGGNVSGSTITTGGAPNVAAPKSNDDAMTPRLEFLVAFGVAVLALTPSVQAQPAVRAESGGVAIGGQNQTARPSPSAFRPSSLNC